MTFSTDEHTKVVARKRISQFLVAVAVIAAAVCSLMWIWVADSRWGLTGLVLFITFVCASAAVQPSYTEELSARMKP